MEKTQTATEGVEKWYLHLIDILQKEDRIWDRIKYKDHFYELYKKAVWIDRNLTGGCAVDPFFNFHFYDEEDAVAFKLRWQE